MEWKERLEVIDTILAKKLLEAGKKNTYEAAAAFFETSTATYGRWKTGRKIPEGDELERICRKLDLSPVWVLLGEGSPEVSENAEGQVASKRLEAAEGYLRLEADARKQLEVRLSETKDKLLEATEEAKEAYKTLSALSVENSHLKQFLASRGLPVPEGIGDVHSKGEVREKPVTYPPTKIVQEGEGVYKHSGSASGIRKG